MRIPLLALVAVLAACTVEPARLQGSAQLAVGQIGYAAPVLDKARRDFLGPGGGFPGGTGGDVPVTSGGGGAALVGLMAVRSHPLTPDLTLQSGTYAELGATTARLPQGLGVFTDAARVRMWAAGLGGDVRVQRTVVTAAGRQLSYGLGLGLTRTMALVDIQSALIDRQSRVWLTQTYATMTLRYQPRRGPDLAADLRLFNTGDTELRLGLAQRW